MKNLNSGSKMLFSVFIVALIYTWVRLLSSTFEIMNYGWNIFILSFVTYVFMVIIEHMIFKHHQSAVNSEAVYAIVRSVFITSGLPMIFVTYHSVNYLENMPAGLLSPLQILVLIGVGLVMALLILALKYFNHASQS